MYKKSVIVDDFQRTPKRLIGMGEDYDQKTGTDMVSNIDFDFTERIYVIHYFGIMDLLSKLGGLRASILPILGYAAPLLALHFLYTLAGIIDDKLGQFQQDEMLKLIKVSLR